MNEERSIKPESPALEERLRVLKEYLPECFSEGRLDPDKLRETLGEENLDAGTERYGLSWPGKKEARARAFRPSKMALHNAPGEGLDEAATKNLVIEGENLEVLRLLQKSYRGRVKMIYIDPPYNTGNDFVYDDKFAESPLEYEKRTGLRAEDGTALQSNRKSSGRYHSNWLSMMYPRLVLARELLADDGLIAISIDDSELFSLRAIGAEVFGEENFVACIVWQKRTSPDARLQVSTAHDYIVVISKIAELTIIEKLALSYEQKESFKNLDNDPRGPWASTDFTAMGWRPNQMYKIMTPGGVEYDPPPGRCWANIEANYKTLLSDNRLWFGKDGISRPRIKNFLSEGEGLTPWTWWTNQEVGHNQEAKKELNEIFGIGNIFETPKPVRLTRKLISLLPVSKWKLDETIILDFFAGSGTTAQAVLELNEEDGGNRQFILVQMPEATPEGSEARKAGYATIAEITKERVRRVAKKLEAEKGKASGRDRGFRVFKLAPTGFKPWKDYGGTSLEEYEKQLSLHLAETEDAADEEDLVAEIMLREGFPLDATVTRLEEGALAVHRVESAASGHRLFVCLDEGFGRSLTVRTFERLGIGTEDVFVCRDGTLSDEAKLRIRELCRLATV